MAVVPDDEPEIATTALWREQMKAARKDAGLTQGQLGAGFNVSQGLISQIEKGEVLASSLIGKISRKLKIAPPATPVRDLEEARWIEAMRRLRDEAPAYYQAQLAGIHSMVESVDKSPPPPTPPKKPRR